LAARDYDVDLPRTPKVWWHVFIGENKDNALAFVTVANAILGLCSLRIGNNSNNDVIGGENDYNDTDVTIDWLVASKGFVPSLVMKNKDDTTDRSAAATAVIGGFNDRGSFLWEYQNDVFVDYKYSEAEEGR
jgi:hypothetical protein